MEKHQDVFISQNTKTEANIGRALKKFLENLFPSINVFTSTNELRSGGIWIEDIRRALKNSKVIIAIISEQSKHSNWIHFEAGAGFGENMTIPLLIPDLSFEQLEQPFKSLQGHKFDNEGIVGLVAEIAMKLNFRTPNHFEGVTELLAETNNRLSIEVIPEVVTSFEATPKREVTAENDLERLANSTRQTVGAAYIADEGSLKEYIKVYNQVKRVFIENCLVVSDKYSIPEKRDLEMMVLEELMSVSGAYNINIPFRIAFDLIILGIKMPLKEKSVHEKMEWRKEITKINERLGEYSLKKSE